MTLRQTRVRRLHPDQAGLTLIELLLAIAITVVIAGFVLQGIAMARRAFQRDGVAERALHADAALQAAGALIAQALPVEMLAKGASRPTMAFEGGGEAVHFIALGNGFALRGGLWSVTIRRDRDALMADLTPVRTGQALDGAATDDTRSVRLLMPVAHLNLRYFGRRTAAEAPGWQEEWRDAERLPDLVAIGISGDESSAARQPIVVPLRQRAQP